MTGRSGRQDRLAPAIRPGFILDPGACSNERRGEGFQHFYPPRREPDNRAIFVEVCLEALRSGAPVFRQIEPSRPLERLGRDLEIEDARDAIGSGVPVAAGDEVPGACLQHEAERLDDTLLFRLPT